MALKTFNLDAEVYEEFSKHCKKHGISMSRKVENFIRDEVGKLKSGSGNIDFRLEVEKSPAVRRGLHRPEEMQPPKADHPMGKFC
ncbi:hypothetical protein CO038_00540 [Candidatus Pacearchaeota archaeon CG_4_9_14_0_2_um_filter_39_13]|nr:hypothetical protein [Candidatus Pacearchaeota archaeon]OIO42976.1 MAG: hypothetical protein AUJ64_03325 [Candidatus Pacearchaeota archaeon CG1_02_39_14]PJC45043.1 MAG: hypothetical protein CO038_00540 [Candidatus Pacearchaeota archaeon CG_4_9_14_0_2_um_filter_39_13]